MDAGFPPTDPLAGLEDTHNGVPSLRLARAHASAGDGAAALAELAAARRAGIPAEAAPHALVIEAVAQLHSGDAAAAVATLLDAWRAHPDVAALPATLGIAQYAAGDAAGAARSLYAAVVGEDPDGSLGAWRTTLTGLRGSIGLR